MFAQDICWYSLQFCRLCASTLWWWWWDGPLAKYGRLHATGSSVPVSSLEGIEASASLQNIYLKTWHLWPLEAKQVSRCSPSRESCSLAEKISLKWDGKETLFADTNVNWIVPVSGFLLLILSKLFFLEVRFYGQVIGNKLDPLLWYSSKWLCLVYVFKWFLRFFVSPVGTPDHFILKVTQISVAWQCALAILLSCT